MNASSVQLLLRRVGVAIVAVCVILAGARGAFLLSQHMMNAVALVGAWMMLALTAVYLVLRFRPSLGIPLLAGFGVSAIVVAVFAGMAMMS
jgi:hypothetical protein